MDDEGSGRFRESNQRHGKTYIRHVADSGTCIERTRARRHRRSRSRTYAFHRGPAIGGWKMASLLTKAGLERDVVAYAAAVERWGPNDWAFRIVSKNAPPRPIAGEPPLASAFKLALQGPSTFSGSGPFKVAFVDQIVTEGGSSQP